MRELAKQAKKMGEEGKLIRLMMTPVTEMEMKMLMRTLVRRIENQESVRESLIRTVETKTRATQKGIELHQSV